MNEQNKVKGLLSSSTLKNIALVFMIIDNVFLKFPSIGPVWHLITRFVAPLFAYLMVDGFFHTRSRKKYCIRLWIAAILMQIGNILSYFLLQKKGIPDNIFLTLALGFSVIYLFELSKSATLINRILYILSGIILIIGATYISWNRIPLLFGCYILLEGGLTVFPFIITSYLFHYSRALQIICSFIISLYFFVTFGVAETIQMLGFYGLCMSSDWMIWQVSPFILLYNGQKGNSRLFGKYFFYIFYPLHLWIIAIAAYFIG
ncbi:MAG: conjugal transfer protein TraX [Lachnospiraceae bacterium]|nr:conjugal transfer protein TraX [Lachnospiraceae bacterium]